MALGDNRNPVGNADAAALQEGRTQQLWPAGSTVTQLIPDRLVEWTVRAVGKPPAGHVYGWQIEPLPDGACLVSNYCDWTNISDERRAKFRWPVVPADRLQHSVENLERLALRVAD